MTAANAIFLSTPTRKISERSSMVVTARFRDRATNADVTPTNVYYSLFDGDGCQITGWTSLTTGTTVSLTLTPTQNLIRNCTRASEAKYLSFAADYGLATEYRETFRYSVTNQKYVS